MRDIYLKPESELEKPSSEDGSEPSILNPWFSMWTKPRATIQQIVDRNPEHLVAFLAAIGGFSEALDRAVMKSLGDKMEWPFIFAIAAGAGSISGILMLYIGGALIKWTGRWMGGAASSQNIRAAMAWANVPIVWALAIWPIELVLFGQELFTTETPTMDSNPTLLYIYMGLAGIEVVIGIWALVVLVKCIGQVQKFSAFKALGNLLTAILVFIIPILVLILGAVWLAQR